MASTHFTTGTTITSEWLNDVNDAVYEGNITAEGVQYTPPFTGGVTETVEAKLAQTVSVKDFGAVGDGVTDDTVAIQAALDYCSANGTILSFDGCGTLVGGLVTFAISSTHPVHTSFGLYIPSDVTIIGKPNCTTIKATTAMTSLVGTDVKSSNISIKGVQFYGNGLVDYALNLAPNLFASHLYISQCTFDNALIAAARLFTFMSTIETCNFNNSPIGLHHAAIGGEGTGYSAGTATSIRDCYAANCNTGYRITSLHYSELNNLACDAAKDTAYYLRWCYTLTVNVGCEVCWRLLDVKDCIGLNILNLYVTDVNTFGIPNYPAGTVDAYVRIDTTSDYTIENYYFDPYSLTSPSINQFYIKDSQGSFLSDKQNSFVGTGASLNYDNAVTFYGSPVASLPSVFVDETYGWRDEIVENTDLNLLYIEFPSVTPAATDGQGGFIELTLMFSGYLASSTDLRVATMSKYLISAICFKDGTISGIAIDEIGSANSGHASRNAVATLSAVASGNGQYIVVKYNGFNSSTPDALSSVNFLTASVKYTSYYAGDGRKALTVAKV